MRKLIFSILSICLFLGLSQIKLNAQERRKGPEIQELSKERPFGEGFEIRKKMMEIERNAIENDPELKSLDEQIKKLQKQLNEKLQGKLATNSEYQELKQKMEQMKQMWRERQRHHQED
ncbi:MAG: hypothetical protein ACP5OB_08545 [Candidatus Ratteibacteria bacterium]